MPPQSIYDAFLAHEGIALFEFGDGAVFTPLAPLPSWCESLWEARGSEPVSLAEKSPFLENFLAEAEAFWDSMAPGAANSGNWIEKDSSGKQFPLEASAFWLAGKRVLLIRNLSGTFSQQQELYQTARDSLLTHERLMREIQKKEILLHCIIHDLSQPLTSMRGCFDLLLGKKLAPELAKFAHTGQRESLRQERMIRGILEAFSGDLAAEQNAQQPVAPASVDLISCARRAVEQFAPAFTERGVRLEMAPYMDTERGWRVVGDASRVDRIFGNLLENALRYSLNGSTVTVGVEDRDSSLTGFVDDEGSGLPEGITHDQLFALFSKGKDRPGKAGLGLYFCKMTVERWGGSIGAENRVGGGSRFWFRLPRVKDSAAPVESSISHAGEDPAAASPSGSSEMPARSLRILLADDDETVRELAAELLRARGHSITGAADGREALSAYERLKPDVVVLDQQMPKMDGLELARAIRQKEKKSGARRAVLVGLSGNATAEDERRALEAGMDALLSKPFERNALFAAIEGRGSSPQAATHLPVAAASASREPDLRAHLARMTNGNEKLARKLVAGFLEDFPPKLSSIEHAVSRKDPDALASAAHALRGAFAIFNAQKSVAAAANLEHMGRDHQFEKAPAEFAVLSADLHRLEGELRALFPQASSPKKQASSRAGSRSRAKRRP